MLLMTRCIAYGLRQWTERVLLVSMNSIERPDDSPIARARQELTDATIFAANVDAISKDEARALTTHLGLYGERLSYPKVSKLEAYLAKIGEAIEWREQYLQDRRLHQAKQLGSTGLLALAVGGQKQAPLSREELLHVELVDQQAVRNPKVDRNVIVDLLAANDLLWLSLPTRPKTRPRL